MIEPPERNSMLASNVVIKRTPRAEAVIAGLAEVAWRAIVLAVPTVGIGMVPAVVAPDAVAIVVVVAGAFL